MNKITYKERIHDLSREMRLDTHNHDHYGPDEVAHAKVTVKHLKEMFEYGYRQCCEDNGLSYSPDDPDVFGAMTDLGLIDELTTCDTCGARHSILVVCHNC